MCTGAGRPSARIFFSISSLIQFYSRSNKKKKKNFPFFFFFLFSIVLQIFISISYKKKQKKKTTHIRSGFLLKSGPAHFHQWLNLQFNIDHPKFFSIFLLFRSQQHAKQWETWKRRPIYANFSQKLLDISQRRLNIFLFVCVLFPSFIIFFWKSYFIWICNLLSISPPPSPFIYLFGRYLWFVYFLIIGPIFFLSLIEPFWIELFFFYIFTCIDRSFFNWLKQEEKNWWSLTSSIRLTCRHHPGSFEMRSIPCRFKTKRMLCDDFLILWIALQYVRFISDRKKYKKGYDIKTSSRKNQLLDTHTN